MYIFNKKMLLTRFFQIGRFDFPDSNYEDLQKSIETVKNTKTYQRICPGHGEPYYKESEDFHYQKKIPFWKKLFGN